MIFVFNNGNYICDFIYVDDIVEGFICVSDDIVRLDVEWWGDSLDFVSSNVFYWIYNIGNNNLVKFNIYIEVLEVVLGIIVWKDLLLF